METITFAKLVENAEAGVQLVKTDFQGNPVTGYWTGTTLINPSSQVMTYVYVTETKQLTAVGMENETDWRIKLGDNGSPATLNADNGLLFLKAAGEERKNYVSANRRADSTSNEFESFKRQAQEALSEWASDALDNNEKLLREFSEVMESVGLEGIKRKYVVSVSVTYTTEVEVEATSEEAARDEVDNNLSDYLYDAIDVSYYEDYNIDDVNEA